MAEFYQLGHLKYMHGLCMQKAELHVSLQVQAKLFMAAELPEM